MVVNLDRSSSANYGLKLGQLKKLILKIENNPVLLPGKKGGHPRGLTPVGMLQVTLFWLKNNPSYDVLASIYGQSRTVVFEATRTLIPILNETLENLGLCPARDLSDKEQRLQFINQLQTSSMIDGTERPIRRPKKKPRSILLREKKRHTVTNLSIVNNDDKTIYLSPTFSGAVHDLSLIPI